MELGEEENQKSSVIHTACSNYQCIYSMPSGVPIVFKNNRAHT